MNEEKPKTYQERGSDRRQVYIDPKDLPFPDRRRGDRRVYSPEEREEILKRIDSNEDGD